MKIKDIVVFGKNELSNAENPILEAQMIVSKVINKDKLYIMLNLDETIKDSEVELIKAYIEKRKNNYPLQYILGDREFWGMDFDVEEGVLIPRQDTEVLIEQTIEIIKKNYDNDFLMGLEIGVGSGIISIVLLKELSYLKLTGVDINVKALDLTRKNALKHGVNERLTLIDSDLFDNLDKEVSFDFIISNPPYIESNIIESLQEDIKNYEPRLALDGGIEGLDFYRAIIDKSFSYLKKGGFIAFEIGYNQAEALKDIMAKKGYQNIDIVKDLAGLDRVVIGVNIW